MAEHRSDYNDLGCDQVGSNPPDEPHISGPGPLGTKVDDFVGRGRGAHVAASRLSCGPQKQLQPTTPNEFRDHHRNLEIVELPKSIPNFKVDFFKL